MVSSFRYAWTVMRSQIDLLVLSKLTSIFLTGETYNHSKPLKVVPKNISTHTSIDLAEIGLIIQPHLAFNHSDFNVHFPTYL